MSHASLKRILSSLMNILRFSPIQHSPELKADRPHPRDYPQKPPDYGPQPKQTYYLEATFSAKEVTLR